MKVGMELTIRHYQGHSTIEEIILFMQSLERYTLQRLSRARDIYSSAGGQSFVSPSAMLPSVSVHNFHPSIERFSRTTTRKLIMPFIRRISFFSGKYSLSFTRTSILESF